MIEVTLVYPYSIRMLLGVSNTQLGYTPHKAKERQTYCEPSGRRSGSSTGISAVPESQQHLLTPFPDS